MPLDAELQAALAFVDKGDNQEALRLFEKINRSNLGPYEQCIILLNEKKCLELLGRLDDAELRLRSVQQLDQSGQFRLFLEAGYIDLLFAKGEFRAFVKRGNAFLARYKEELKKPEYENVRYGLNMNVPCALVNSGQFESAILGLQSFLPHAREEDCPQVHLFLGIAYEQLGQPDNAVSEFETVLRLKPPKDEAGEAHYRLGAHHLKANAPALAKKYFLAAECLKDALPSIPLRDLYIFLANTCGQLGEEDERQKYLHIANLT